jgi:hypothetical protein
MKTRGPGPALVGFARELGLFRFQTATARRSGRGGAAVDVRLNYFGDAVGVGVGVLTGIAVPVKGALVLAGEALGLGLFCSAPVAALRSMVGAGVVPRSVRIGVFAGALPSGGAVLAGVAVAVGVVLALGVGVGVGDSSSVFIPNADVTVNAMATMASAVRSDFIC